MLVEKEWYRLLMLVQGIGAKVSLAIFGVLGADGVSCVIVLGDWNVVAKVCGVGLKTAQCVIIELKDKAFSVMVLGVGLFVAIGDEVIEVDPVFALCVILQFASIVQADVMLALVNLGYVPGDAASVVV